MKKIVPDPPRLKLIISPHFSVHSDMLPTRTTYKRHARTP